jgi:hypothetical protein
VIMLKVRDSVETYLITTWSSYNRPIHYPHIKENQNSYLPQGFSE